MLPNSPGHKDD
jgi:hypothetical protein